MHNQFLSHVLEYVLAFESHQNTSNLGQVNMSDTNFRQESLFHGRHDYSNFYNRRLKKKMLSLKLLEKWITILWNLLLQVRHSKETLIFDCDIFNIQVVLIMLRNETIRMKNYSRSTNFSTWQNWCSVSNSCNDLKVTSEPWKPRAVLIFLTSLFVNNKECVVTCASHSSLRVKISQLRLQGDIQKTSRDEKKTANTCSRREKKKLDQFP